MKAKKVAVLLLAGALFFGNSFSVFAEEPTSIVSTDGNEDGDLGSDDGSDGSSGGGSGVAGGSGTDGSSGSGSGTNDSSGTDGVSGGGSGTDGSSGTNGGSDGSSGTDGVSGGSSGTNGGSNGSLGTDDGSGGSSGTNGSSGLGNDSGAGAGSGAGTGLGDGAGGDSGAGAVAGSGSGSEAGAVTGSGSGSEAGAGTGSGGETDDSGISLLSDDTVDSTPVTGDTGYTDISIEGTSADGETLTKFEVDNTILGGDLIVSIPAEMTLEYDADNGVMTKLDYVSASGRCAANQKLEIRTATSITYADDSNASITVPGTVTFGVTEGDKQLENWTAVELLTGVKTPDSIVKRDIAATVQKSDIDYIGSYSSLILYNITVVETDSTTEEPPVEGEP